MISTFSLRMLLAAVMGALACASPVWAVTSASLNWTGVVTYVVDGDTVHVRPLGGEKSETIRIGGIDAPEICQPGGTVARDALKRRVLGRRVVVQGKVRDDYGRFVARIFFDKQDQGKWLVSQGLAWSYRYRNNLGPYVVQQGHAQVEKLGVFALPYVAAPVDPAEFRKEHGSCYARYR